MIYKSKDIFDLDDDTPMWDHFENWFCRKLEDEALADDYQDDDETRDMGQQDLLCYLREMKYSVNDCLKMKSQIINIYSELEKTCDQRVQEIKQELIKIWAEE